jgi:hypothetical protein
VYVPKSGIGKNVKAILLVSSSLLVLLGLLTALQLQTVRAVILTLPKYNNMTLDTNKPFDHEFAKVMDNPIVKTKEGKAAFANMLFKEEAVVDNCVTQNTSNSTALLPLMMTKICDAAASFVTQFCQISSVNSDHPDLCNNQVVKNYISQRQLVDETLQNQLAWGMLKFAMSMNKNQTNSTNGFPTKGSN